MASERIDHAARAARATRQVQENCETDDNTDALLGMLAAQVHATLALVEQQRIANLIALPPTDSAATLYASERPHPDIAAALGIELEAAGPAGGCTDHHPVQHRDARPPWCNKCGLTASGRKPGGSVVLGRGGGSDD